MNTFVSLRDAITAVIHRLGGPERDDDGESHSRLYDGQIEAVIRESKWTRERVREEARTFDELADELRRVVREERD